MVHYDNVKWVHWYQIQNLPPNPLWHSLLGHGLQLGLVVYQQRWLLVHISEVLLLKIKKNILNFLFSFTYVQYLKKFDLKSWFLSLVSLVKEDRKLTFIFSVENSYLCFHFTRCVFFKGYLLLMLCTELVLDKMIERCKKFYYYISIMIHQNNSSSIFKVITIESIVVIS